MQQQDYEFSLKDHENALLPTEGDLSFYREHGYYVSGYVLSEEEIDELSKDVEA